MVVGRSAPYSWMWAAGGQVAGPISGKDGGK